MPTERGRQNYGLGSARNLTLAADALVTYAFELLAAEPERLEAVAGAAMRRIAAHGVPAS